MPVRIAAAILVGSILLFTCFFPVSHSSSPAYNTNIGTDDPALQLASGSGLPVISIITSDGKLPGDVDSAAQMTVYQSENGHMVSTTALIEIKERGNTSRRFPKKSYRVKIVDEDGEKRHLSLLGMRSDDDWILNPMYSDTSKIREALGYELWAQINTSGMNAASSRVEYTEIFINGEYWGLYGLQERIDRKQVDGSKRSGIVYKIIANDRPTTDELLSCGSSEVCRGFELEFSGASVKDPWVPAAAYMAVLNNEEHSLPAYLSIENTIDYGLWAMLCQAHDCHFKNQFINCVYDGGSYTMYKIPWDLNNTFGDVWKNDADEANYTAYHIGSLVIDGAFGLLLESDNPEVYIAIQDRWRFLRETVITEDNLIAMAYDIYYPLTAAIERDNARWPECGMGNGNAANIRDIENYIRVTLPKMDSYIFGLGTE